MSIRVGMVSLGCPKNQMDAELMLAKMEHAGLEIVADAALADVVIVNTCGFIEDAKKESIEQILEFAKLKDEGRIKRIIVTGCMAERYRDELVKELPECDAVLGLGANGDIVEAIANRTTPILLTHWQALYSNGTWAGLRILEEVARRVQPLGLQWRSFDEIKEMTLRG